MPVEYENVLFPFQTTMTKILQEIAKEISVQYTSAKKVLLNWIVKSGHSHIITTADDGQKFMFVHVRAAQGSMPTWIILTPEPAVPIKGIDMGMGAECGFFGPMNPNNSTGTMHSNFCMALGERISQPEFGP